MKRKLKWISIGAALLAITLFAGTIIASQDLDKIRADIKEDYDVQHVSNAELDRLSSDEVVIFDVRKLEEYNVSHIKKAVHLDPRTSPNEFFDQYLGQLENKTVVFYCSVGQRSSAMLSRLQTGLTNNGINNAYNLDGGAFKRHNDQLGLMRDGGVTRDIHPYNAYYGRLIDDKDSIKYE